MTSMVRQWIAALAILLASAVPGPGGAVAAGEDWTGTTEQKVWGLMQVWGAVKRDFAFFDHVPDLDWDDAVRAAMPRVLAAESRDEYYRRLNELVSRVRDGHTLAVPPSWRDGTEDAPALEFQVVEDRLVLVRTGDTDEIRAQRLRPGLELIAVGDGVPALQYLRDHALSCYAGSTAQGGAVHIRFVGEAIREVG